jgi:hypothetical protein
MMVLVDAVHRVHDHYAALEQRRETRSSECERVQMLQGYHPRPGTPEDAAAT